MEVPQSIDDVHGEEVVHVSEVFQHFDVEVISKRSK